MVSDKILLYLLSIIRVYNSQNKQSIKNFSVIIIVFYYVSIIYYLAVDCRHIVSYFQTSCTYLILHFLSILVWYVLFIRRKRLPTIIQEMYRYRKRYNVRNNASKRIQNIALFLTLIIFVLSQLLHHFEDKSKNIFLDIHTFGITVSKGNLKIIIVIFINLAFFIAYAFPVFVTFILSVVLYKWGETIQFYNKSLQRHLRAGMKHVNMNLFADFINMTKLLREMNHILNYPLLCIILYSLYGILVSLYELLMWNDVSFSMLTNMCIKTGLSILMLLMYSICSSTIPESLHEIRTTVREKINDQVFGLSNYIPQNVLLCLNRMETETTVIITVCGVFRLTKSFILSAIGSVLTYDFLIINTFMR